MPCATFLFAKSVSLGIPCKVLLIELAKDTFPTSGNLLVISKIAADLLSLFSKLLAKSFVFRILLPRVVALFDDNDDGDD
jgi:hypothetical protein